MKVFFLASDLSAGDAAGQLTVLAAGLPRDRFAVAVGAPGPDTGAAADLLRAAGVPVVSLPVRHSFDLSGMRRFCRAVSAVAPDVLHAFGPGAVRLSRLVVSADADGKNTPRLVVTGAADPGRGLGGWLACRQLRRADRVIATGWAEGERYRRLGVHSDRLTRIHPAAEPPGSLPDRAAFCRDINVPPAARLIFGAGRLDAAHGLKDAVIAFDMLRYESPDLHLVLTGSGPDRQAAEDLARAVAFDDLRVRFSGERPDLAAATQLAELVWVTAARGGEYLALRAMAAGKPVAAFRTPELEEVIDDGTTGFLVPPGDRAALAEKTRLLLTDPALANRVGEAGRQRAADLFGAARHVEQHARVYDEIG